MHEVHTLLTCLISVLAKIGLTPTAELDQFLPSVSNREDAAEPLVLTIYGTSKSSSSIVH